MSIWYVWHRLTVIELTCLSQRFGVTDESTLDHKTWLQCLRELKRCESESTGLYFLSLQADKYGYCALPRNLGHKEFEARLAQFAEGSPAVTLAREWYVLDENSVPPSYVLRRLTHLKDTDYWDNVLPTLRKLFENICIDDLGVNDELVIGRSVTEWETKYALHDEANLDRCRWIHRAFAAEEGEGTSIRRKSIGKTSYSSDKGEERNIKSLFSTGDISEKLKLGNLKAWMTSKLEPSSLITEYSDITLSQYRSHDDVKKEEYLRRWESSTEEMLRQEINKIIRLRVEWDREGCGLGAGGDELDEILHHAAWAYEKCNTFEGREDLLAHAMQLFNRDNRSGDADMDDLTLKFDGVSFAITGSSGCGYVLLCLPALAYNHNICFSQNMPVLSI